MSHPRHYNKNDLLTYYAVLSVSNKPVLTAHTRCAAGLDKLQDCGQRNKQIIQFFNSGKRRYNIKLWKTFTDCFNCLPIAAIGRFSDCFIVRYSSLKTMDCSGFLVHAVTQIGQNYKTYFVHNMFFLTNVNSQTACIVLYCIVLYLTLQNFQN